MEVHTRIRQDRPGALPNKGKGSIVTQPIAFPEKTQSYSLQSPPSHVEIANYDHTLVDAGVLHIGYGSFIKALLAFILNLCLGTGGDTQWGLRVASIRSNNTIKRLRQADHRVVLVERENNDYKAHLLRSIVDSISGRDEPLRLLSAVASSVTKVITFTVTNKGYYLNADGKLDAAHPDIVHDLSWKIGDAGAPKTILWYLRHGLVLRTAPVTMLSLDNLPENSRILRSALLQFIQLTADEESTSLLAWIEEFCDFRCSVVDRITPEPTDRIRSAIASWLGFDPIDFVATEPIWQLVIESGRFETPDWERVGVKVVDNIAHHGMEKFWVVNVGHQLLVAMGQRLGATYVHEAVAFGEVKAMLNLFYKEMATALGAHVSESYGPQTVRRFENSCLEDTLRRVGARTTSKMSERVLKAVELGLEKTGELFLTPTFTFACYLFNLSNLNDQAEPFTQDDPQQPLLAEFHEHLMAWLRDEYWQHHDLGSLLTWMSELIGDPLLAKLSINESFVSELEWSLRNIDALGTTGAITALLARIESGT